MLLEFLTPRYSQGRIIKTHYILKTTTRTTVLQ